MEVFLPLRMSEEKVSYLAGLWFGMWTCQSIGISHLRFIPSLPGQASEGGRLCRLARGWCGDPPHVVRWVEPGFLWGPVNNCACGGDKVSRSSVPLLFIHLASIYCGEGNGTPLQCSCLENPMDGGAWWAIGHGSLRVGHD